MVDHFQTLYLPFDVFFVVVLFVFGIAGVIVGARRDQAIARAKTAATARKIALTTTPQMWEVRP